jgi:hypothetical protein
MWLQVAVVRQRDSGQIFAMKMLHKWEMLKRAEVSLGFGGIWSPCKWAREDMCCQLGLADIWGRDGAWLLSSIGCHS